MDAATDDAICHKLDRQSGLPGAEGAVGARAFGLPGTHGAGWPLVNAIAWATALSCRRSCDLGIRPREWRPGHRNSDRDWRGGRDPPNEARRMDRGGGPDARCDAPALGLVGRREPLVLRPRRSHSPKRCRNVAEHPGDIYFFLKFSHRNSILMARLTAELLSLSPQARFARLLLRLATPGGTAQVTQEELGRKAGMSRAAFRRSCAALIDAGAVRIDYGRVHIVDRVQLKRAAALD